MLPTLEEVIVGSLMGRSSDDFNAEYREYKKKLERYKRKERRSTNGKVLVEIAYWSGRVEVLGRFVARSRRGIPPYYNPVQLRPEFKEVYFSW